jgi:hydrogenase expression/formation protein HypC
MNESDPIMRMGRVSFGGIVRKVNLAFVPEAVIGDYVLVHAGFAIQIINEREADKTFEYLQDVGLFTNTDTENDEIH